MKQSMKQFIKNNFKLDEMSLKNEIKKINKNKSNVIIYKKHINPNKVLIVNKKVNYVISNENINKIYYIFINDKKYKSIFTLIDIVRHLYDLDFKNTLIKLDNVSEFNFIKNNQLNILKNKIENNLDYVNSLIEHPVYRKIIVNIKDTIETINRIELGIYNDISRNKEGDHYFFISQDKLSKIINKSRGIAGKHLNMMVFLGLLNKLEYSDIPKKSLLRINKKNNFKNISFYSIPNYKEKKDIIEMYLFLAKSKKITLNNLTTKKLINDLDISEADRVFRYTEIEEYKVKLLAKKRLIDDRELILEDTIKGVKSEIEEEYEDLPF